MVHLDIKESAQQGMGPHGLVIGATGSGKSEFLRTLVLGLAMTHSPEQLNMVLVDFKGGATFAGMSEMPHVSAVITNLAQELTLVDRMQDALSGEMVRRQELLREAGNFASVRDYEKARAAGEDLAPLPSLFIVVDEFSEMLSAKPEFIDLFVAIGRLGRSLGPAPAARLAAARGGPAARPGVAPVLPGRPAHVQRRRVPLGARRPRRLRAAGRSPASATSSPTRRRCCGSRRPTSPGRRRAGCGYAATRAATCRASCRSRSPRCTRSTSAEPEPEPDARAGAAGRAGVAARHRGRPHGRPRPGRPPGLAAAARRARHARRADARPRRGPPARAWSRRSGAAWAGSSYPLGTVDRPREQRRDTLTVDLGGASGHVAVVGGPRSGKSTLLRTIVTSMSLTTTPLESQFFVLDFGGGTFAPLAGLPHVAGVGTRSEPDVVRRIVAEVQGVVDRREAYFRAHGIDSIETYRSRRAAGRADDGYGDVFLVVDGWSTLRADFDDLEIELQQLAARGLTFGLHIVAGAARWADFRAAMRDIFGTRLELRLGDPMDSEIDRKIAALVPTGRPGRGLVQGKLHFLAALPRIDGDRRRRARSATASTTWSSGSRPPGRARPARSCGCSRTGSTSTRCAARPSPPAADRRLLLGIDEKELAPVGARRRRRAAPAGLRRRPVRQERGAAGLRARGDAHPHAARRRRSSSSTTGARCSARCPTSTCSTT